MAKKKTEEQKLLNQMLDLEITRLKDRVGKIEEDHSYNNLQKQIDEILNTKDQYYKYHRRFDEKASRLEKMEEDIKNIKESLFNARGGLGDVRKTIINLQNQISSTHNGLQAQINQTRNNVQAGQESMRQEINRSNLSSFKERATLRRNLDDISRNNEEYTRNIMKIHEKEEHIKNAVKCKNCGNRIDKDPKYTDFLCTNCGAIHSPKGNLIGYTFFTCKTQLKGENK